MGYELTDGRNRAWMEGDAVIIRIDSPKHGVKALLVPAEAWETLKPFRWCVRLDPKARTFYASAVARRGPGPGTRTTVLAHRLIHGLDPGIPLVVDHIDHNGLNNLPANTRVVSRSRNQHNLRDRRTHNGRKLTSPHPGVSWYRWRSKWLAQIRSGGRLIHLGLHDDELEAAETYQRAKAVRDAGGTVEEIKATRRK